MTVNKQQKAKIIEQLLICTTIELQTWGDFSFSLTTQRTEGWREKNIRSGEPVQNIINVNIWVGIYISYSHIIIWKKKPSYIYQYTKTKIQNVTSQQR